MAIIGGAAIHGDVLSDTYLALVIKGAIYSDVVAEAHSRKGVVRRRFIGWEVWFPSNAWSVSSQGL